MPRQAVCLAAVFSVFSRELTDNNNNKPFRQWGMSYAKQSNGSVFQGPAYFGTMAGGCTFFENRLYVGNRGDTVKRNIDCDR